MNYGTTTYIYGPSPLTLKYNDEKLKDLIGEFIKTNKEFSYSQLCNYMLSVADQQDMLDKKPNTSYSQILLTHQDAIRISKNLWDRIWLKEIIVLFNDPQDIYNSDKETIFIAIK